MNQAKAVGTGVLVPLVPLVLSVTLLCGDLKNQTNQMNQARAFAYRVAWFIWFLWFLTVPLPSGLSLPGWSCFGIQGIFCNFAMQCAALCPGIMPSHLFTILIFP